ncbi:hypothetical protein SISSUDRAFT_95663 [Sistotremastrum suecicum HHB10207 ss-3]|uniref:G-protein coupled receptors family 1 profile domain-containing protein n=1 Tax=Sistotremastrum suecicum HHB10207 ss-3 TaxID=1314776 RepID=A0A166B744_9AGAM|nr:hypothetical protein SISSUDRAFT_95663 [Sistotremastrum suecicum HHB10207 ss-3]
MESKALDPALGNVVDSGGSFSFGIRVGIIFTLQTSVLSAILLTTLLLYILYQEIKFYRQNKKIELSAMLIYFISLLVSDLIHSVGGLIGIKWVQNAGVIEGAACTAQGMLLQMGDVSSALSIFAITLTTFGVACFPRKSWGCPSSRVAYLVVSLIWSFVFFVVIISFAVHRNKAEPYYGNTGYWCWIRSPTYWKDGIGLEYAWMWLAGLSNILLYIPAAIIVVKGRKNLQSNPNHDIEDTSTCDKVSYGGDPYARSVALKMSLYPIVYLITITPMSIARYIQFAHPQRPPPFEYIIAASFLFSSAGTFNAILFTFTRPNLIPGKSKDDREEEALRRLKLEKLEKLDEALKRTDTRGTDFICTICAKEPSLAYMDTGSEETKINGDAVRSQDLARVMVFDVREDYRADTMRSLGRRRSSIY